MFDLLSVMGSAVIGEIIKRAIGAGVEWGKNRKKPKPEDVKEKVEALVADATKKVAAPESLPPLADRQKMITSIAELVLPTFEQVVKYSPNTKRVMHAAGLSQTAARKSASKKAVKKSAATKKPTKKSAKRLAKRH